MDPPVKRKEEGAEKHGMSGREEGGKGWVERRGEGGRRGGDM